MSGSTVVVHAWQKHRVIRKRKITSVDGKGKGMFEMRISLRTYATSIFTSWWGSIMWVGSHYLLFLALTAKEKCVVCGALPADKRIGARNVTS